MSFSSKEIHTEVLKNKAICSQVVQQNFFKCVCREQENVTKMAVYNSFNFSVDVMCFKIIFEIEKAPNDSKI